MRTNRLMALAAFFLMVSPAFLNAQGSGSTARVPRPAAGGLDAYDVTTSITGTLVKVAENGKTFQVEDERTGRTYQFTRGERTRFRADKKVLGKKKIAWSELAEGQRVRVVVKVPQDRGASIDALALEVREIKVIRPRAT